MVAPHIMASNMVALNMIAPNITDPSGPTLVPTQNAVLHDVHALQYHLKRKPFQLKKLHRIPTSSTHLEEHPGHYSLTTEPGAKMQIWKLPLQQK